MQYIIKGSQNKYTFNYQEEKERYNYFVNLSDEQFLKQLPNALHFACFISYVKQLGLESTIADEGLIHELIHLMTVDECKTKLSEIRKQFEELLKLA